jgi:hypothetical protein
MSVGCGTVVVKLQLWHSELTYTASCWCDCTDVEMCACVLAGDRVM